MEFLIAVVENYVSKTPIKTVLGFSFILCLLKDFSHKFLKSSEKQSDHKIRGLESKLNLKKWRYSCKYEDTNL